MNVLLKYYAARSGNFQIEKNIGMDIVAVVTGLGYILLFVWQPGNLGPTSGSNLINEVVLVAVGVLLFCDLIVVPFASAATMLGTAPILVGLFNYGIVIPNTVIAITFVVWLFMIGLRKWRVTVFNVFQIGISAYAAYIVFTAIGGHIGHAADDSITQFLLATGVYMIVNLSCTYILLTARMHGDITKAFKYVATRQYLDVNILYVVEMFFAIAMTISLKSVGLWSVILLLGVLWFSGNTYKRYRTLLVYSYQDPLTGLYNRRYFSTTVKDQLKNDNPASLFMIDIDNFKKYNDTWGHVKGDEVLRNVGQVLDAVCSPYGIVARYGGEEFAVFLPSMTAEQASEVGAKLAKQIAETEFEGSECMPDGRVTVSVGIAEYPTMGTNYIEILERADKALYLAKAQGKNRVVVDHETAPSRMTGFQ